MTRLSELKAATLAAVRVEDRPVDYIEAQALEDGYSLALEDLAPVLAAAQVAHIQLNEAIEFLQEGIGYASTPLVSKVLAEDFMVSALALRDALAEVSDA